ncbi:MAG: IS4 family transposase [Flavobacteriales bacterium]|nr:IS4 family transposase [Flavobacteriales bacterium]
MVNVNLFAQVVSLLPGDAFKKIIKKHKADKHSKGLNCWTHLVSMLFCQLASAGSVRDISNGLPSIAGNIFHLGCSQSPSKSSISYINKHRSSDVFRDMFYALLGHLCGQHKFKRPALKRLRKKNFILDATLIPLCLSIFDWAHYRTRKGAVKLHMVLDYDGCLPVFACLTEGRVADVKVARVFDYPKGSIVVFDRGYYDFTWWKELDSSHISFVTRAKENLQYEVRTNYEIDKAKSPHMLLDADVTLTGDKASKEFGSMLRLVQVVEEQSGEVITFLTNQRSWTAQTVADIYRERWRIEIFFKHLKQRLKIKSFVGTSQNAVEIQIWTALMYMLLLSYLKEKAAYCWHLSNLIAFIRLHLFVKTNLMEWINKPFMDKPPDNSEQLALF